jgi:hypothetical protein
MMGLIYSCYRGVNADIVAAAVKLHVKPGDMIADATYGRGKFWDKVDMFKVTLLRSDVDNSLNSALVSQADFRDLPYADGSLDGLFLDPPYRRRSGDASIVEGRYGLTRSPETHEGVVRLYGLGIIEAARVLGKGGRIFVKCQDETTGRQLRLTHIEIIEMMKVFGFAVIDLFVLMQQSAPPPSGARENNQVTARKNHSYLVVGRLRR